MSWINLAQVLYFKEVVECGSMTLAAKKLSISSPALSMQIKALEELVGQDLFTRKSNRLFITEFGEDLYEHAQKLGELEAQMLSLISHPQTQKRMSIGIDDALPKKLSLILTGHIRKKETDLSISFLEGNQKDLLKSLLSFDIDMAFTNVPLTHESGEIVSKEFAREKVGMYAAKKMTSLKKNFPKSIDGSSLITPTTGSDIRHSLEEWLLKNSVNIKSTIEVQDSGVKKLLATRGHGIVALPHFGAKDLVKNGELVKIGELKGVEETYYWSTRRKNKKNEHLTKSIIENLKI